MDDAGHVAGTSDDICRRTVAGSSGSCGHVDTVALVGGGHMKMNRMQLDILNAASVEGLKESKVDGLLINDGRIVGRLDEEEDIQKK